MEDGRIVGVKHFTYLVVADSAGVHSIRDVSVAFLDLDSHRYGELRAAPVDVVAGENATTIAQRAAPPGLLSDSHKPLLPAPEWPDQRLGLLLLGAPLLAVVMRGRPGFLKRRRKAAPTLLPSLTTLHRQFRTTLERLMGTEDVPEGDGLSDALRAAGIDQVVAAHAARVRDRLRNAIYGPGRRNDSADLTAETLAVLRVLTGEPSGPEASGRGSS
jgi:hypothetical protein